MDVVDLNQPEISAASAARLRADANDYRRGQWPPYGMPIAEILARPGIGREWFEAVVLAGWIPDIDGIELALHGAYEWTIEQIEEAHGTGADGDAIGWADCVAKHFDEIAYRVEGLAHALRARGRAIEAGN